MKAYVIAEQPAVTGMVARVTNLYEGPQIRFSGASGGKAATIEVTMHPADALTLASALIDAAGKHGSDTLRQVRCLSRRLEKRLRAQGGGNAGI